MWFIVAIEDYLVVALEEGCCSGPPSLKTCVVCDDVSIVTSEVVGIEDGIGAFGGNIVEVLNHGVSVSCISATSHYSGNETLHHDGNTCVLLACFRQREYDELTECIHAFPDQSIDC